MQYVKKEIPVLWIIVNVVAFFLALNPWITGWSSQAAALLIFEILFLIVIGLPVFLYYFLRRKNAFSQSISDSLETVLDFLAGWVQI